MHILILSKRNADAQARLLRSAAQLAMYFELDSHLVDALKPTSKDGDVRALQEREATADLLEALVTEIMPAPEMSESPVTTVTDGAAPDAIATSPLPPFEEQIHQAEQLAQDVLIEGFGPVLPGDLPAPVLDEVAAEAAPAEEVAEEQPAPIDQPVKTSKRSTSSKKKSGK